MTMFFRRLADVPVEEADGDALAEPLREAFYDGDAFASAGRAALARWLPRYAARARQEAVPGALRRERMNRVNPKYVFRNYLAQQAIDALEGGDASVMERLTTRAAAPLRRAAGAGGPRGPAPRVGALQAGLLGPVLQLVSPRHFPFSRTSSSGAAHGYGSISISPGSATRGPIPLTQMNS